MGARRLVEHGGNLRHAGARPQPCSRESQLGGELRGLFMNGRGAGDGEQGTRGGPTA